MLSRKYASRIVLLALFVLIGPSNLIARDISDAVFLLTFLFVDNTKAPYGDPTYTSKCVLIPDCGIEDPSCK